MHLMRLITLRRTRVLYKAPIMDTFTPAANAISLRGLGPNHTLTLINGHRVADYPVPYDGSVNFVNLANIPTAIIDRIEILNGGASAIYGSDAIAGVVNIILKRKQMAHNLISRQAEPKKAVKIYVYN